MGRHPMSASAEQRLADGPPTGVLVSFRLEGNEIHGLRGVVRWLRTGLHQLLNDGPTRRAVDKLAAAIDVDTSRKEGGS